MSRSPSGRYHDWSAIVRKCRSAPNLWVVRLVDEPRRLVRTIRDRSAPELHLDDGVMEAGIVNSYVDAGGRRRGDIYIRFRPHDGAPGDATLPLDATPKGPDGQA